MCAEQKRKSAQSNGFIFLMVLGIEPRPCIGYANAVSLSFIPQLTGLGMDEEGSIDLGQSGLHRELRASLRDT